MHFFFILNPWRESVNKKLSIIEKYIGKCSEISLGIVAYCTVHVRNIVLLMRNDRPIFRAFIVFILLYMFVLGYINVRTKLTIATGCLLRKLKIKTFFH